MCRAPVILDRTHETFINLVIVWYVASPMRDNSLWFQKPYLEKIYSLKQDFFYFIFLTWGPYVFLTEALES